MTSKSVCSLQLLEQQIYRSYKNLLNKGLNFVLSQKASQIIGDCGQQNFGKEHDIVIIL